MTTRVQALRSSTTGALPAAGSRLPGELWTNFADLQAGVIDASKNAQRLIAVRYFSASANYVAGDFVIQAGVLYAAKGAITAGAFNAANWTQVATATDTGGPYLSVAVGASTYLPLAGGTMTGLVTLSGPPSNPLHAATKAYVDAGAFVPLAGGVNTGLNDNRLINGDMRIDQRNNGASGTASGYTVDRWYFGAAQSGKLTWGRNLNAISGPAGFPYYFGVQSSSAYASIAADTFQLLQQLEGDAVSDFAWGAVNAQPVTLSFWAYSSLTGTFSADIRGASIRSYPFTYSIPTANTWTKIVVTIPGDTAGAWALSGNAAALTVCFDLGSGSTYRGPANAWASTTYIGVTGSVSLVGTNAATFYVTGVKLEVGSVATPYNRQSLAKSMADCQRYYQAFGGHMQISGYGTAGGSIWGILLLPVVMRAAPTVVYSSVSYTNASGLVMSGTTTAQLTNQAAITATGPGYAVGTAALSAEL